MITPGYSLTAPERILPRFALDFTTAVLDPRITITRALNTATRFNSSGLIEIVNADLPRFDYDPISKTLLGLLIEEQRSNIVLHSQAFNNWSDGGASVNANAVVAPDGTTTADELVRTTGTSDYRSQTITFTGNGTKSISIFVQYNTAPTFTVFFYDTTAAAARAFIDFSFTAGVPAASTINAGSIEAIDNVGAGWYRIKIVAPNVVAANNNVLYVYPARSGASNGQKTTFWGAQAENGAFATSYIPTTTTSVQRNADVATITGTNFSAWWQATTGAAAVRARQRSVAATSPWLQFDDNTADNIIAFRGNTTNPELYIKATTDQAQIDAGTIAADTNYGLTGAWNTNDCAASINGAAAVTDTSATIPTVTQARLGSDGTNYLNGWLQSVRYWPQRITNAETQAFSKL